MERGKVGGGWLVSSALEPLPPAPLPHSPPLVQGLAASRVHATVISAAQYYNKKLLVLFAKSRT